MLVFMVRKLLLKVWLDPGMWWKPDVKGVEGPSVLGRLPTPDSPTESESF